MDLEWIECALSRHYDLLRLLFNRKSSYKRSHLLCRLPFRKLSKSLLALPHRAMDNLEKELTSPRRKDEDSSIDRLSGKITLVCFMNSDTIDISVIDEPDQLVREQLSIIRCIQIRLGRLARVELKAFPDSLSQNVKSRVGFHDFIHRLL